MPIQNVLKSGPSFPFKTSITDILGPKTRSEHIFSSIQMILTTPKGSLKYDPNYGSFVPFLVFDIISEDAINLLYYYIVQDLNDQEPRVRVNSIQVVRSDRRKLIVWLGFVDANDETQVQQQAPIVFTLKEGLP